MRRKIVAGNWKMNLDFQEAQDLLEGVANLCEDQQPDCDIIVCPPYLYLELATDMADEFQYFYVGAQNVNENESGAYTGEVSAKMLDSIGTNFCILKEESILTKTMLFLPLRLRNYWNIR